MVGKLEVARVIVKGDFIETLLSRESPHCCPREAEWGILLVSGWQYNRFGLGGPWELLGRENKS